MPIPLVLTQPIILLILALDISGCASTGTAGRSGPRVGADYTGDDAGVLVYAVGTVRGFGMRFSFPYGRVQVSDGAATDDWKGRIRPSVGGAIYLKILNPDFEGFETGHVVTRKLPPGHYAISDFEFFGSGPAGSYEWNSKVPFSIEFVIEAGKATYIGSFMRSLAPPGGAAGIGAPGYFLIANRSDRDLPIARPRMRADITILKQVTDVEKFGSAVLRSKSLEPMDAAR